MLKLLVHMCILSSSFAYCWSLLLWIYHRVVAQFVQAVYNSYNEVFDEHNMNRVCLLIIFTGLTAACIYQDSSVTTSVIYGCY